MHTLRKPLADVAAGWNRFFFTPTETSTLGLLRIAYGVLITLWTLSLLPDLLAFFGPGGILPDYPQEGPWTWGVLALSTSTPLLFVVYFALLMAAIALTIGYRSRIAGVAVWVGVLSFAHRNPLIGNSGDELIGNVALFLALAPSGAALSLDRWLAVGGDRKRFWKFPKRAPWALRLVQIQLSLVYLTAVWDKVQGDLWRNGTAVSYALRIADVGRVPTPEFVTHSVVLSELMTYGTLALEASLGILVWNRAARPWVLSLGILMHLGIDVSILVGFFSYTMLVCYLSFLPAGTATRYILRARDWQRRRAARTAAPAAEERPAATPGPAEPAPVVPGPAAPADPVPSGSSPQP
jgi:hypothetical protein